MHWKVGIAMHWKVGVNALEGWGSMYWKVANTLKTLTFETGRSA